MVEKSCARSHGHPVPGVRSAAMISIRRTISREAVMLVMSDDPRRPGRLGRYQGSTLPCKRFANDPRYPLQNSPRVRKPNMRLLTLEQTKNSNDGLHANSESFAEDAAG